MRLFVFFAYPKSKTRVPYGLALLLLVLGILANNHHVAFSLDDFALFANLLDGRLNFHCFIPFLSFRTILLFSPGDASLGEIVRGDLDRDGIAGKNFDIVHAKLARNVCGHDMTVREFYFECGVRQCFDYLAVFKFYKIVLWQNNHSYLVRCTLCVFFILRR